MDNKLPSIKEREDNIVIYTSDNGKVNLEVKIEDDNVWLTQQQMSQLFGKAVSTINEHLKNIFAEGELQESLCTHKFGNSEFMQKAPLFYNLDVIFKRANAEKEFMGLKTISMKQNFASLLI